MAKIFDINTGINPVVALSANYDCDDTFSFFPVLKQWNNGLYSIETPIFNGIKDVSINRQSLMFITSAINFNNFATNGIIPSGIYISDGQISLSANNGFYVNYNSNDDIIADSVSEVIFQVELNNDGSQSFSIKVNNRIYYLTINEMPPYEIELKSRDYTDLYNRQKFYLISFNGLEDISLYVSFYDDMGIIRNRFIKCCLDGRLRAVGAQPIGASRYKINNYGGGYQELPTFTGYTGENKYVKYNTDFEFSESKINVNSIKSLSCINQNYFIDCPYKTGIGIQFYDDNKNIIIGKMDINFTNLKNIQTPNYEYTQYPYISSGIALIDDMAPEFVKRREYTKIFTGTNQEYGYYKPILGYVGNTIEIKLLSDKNTYFHYPCCSPMIPLSSSGLIESGAIAGNIPNRADKIFKKMANYKKYIWWGDSQQWQEGTWYCSWLSGSEDGRVDTKPVWKDRWFLAGYLSGSVVDGTEVFVENNPIIWDEDSIMTFDPGVWYNYQHIGKSNVQRIINSFSGLSGNLLKLNYDEWTGQNIYDSSMYNISAYIPVYDDSIIREYRINNNTLENYIYLNGKDQHVFVPYSLNYSLSDICTVGCWIYSDDWSKNNNSHILSKGRNTGWFIEYDNNFNNLYVPFGEMIYGHVILSKLNTDIYCDKFISPTSGGDVEPTCMVQGLGYIWILDNKYKKLYRMEYNGDIYKKVSFGNDTELSAIHIDNNENIIVFDTKNNEISSFRLDCTYLSSYSIPLFKYNDIDLNNNIISRERQFFIDNTNSVIEITAFDIYNREMATCDKDNNYWVLFDKNKFAKYKYLSYNNSFKYLLSGTLVGSSYISDNRNIDFVQEYDCVNNTLTDYAWIVHAADNKVYKYDMLGNYIDSIKLQEAIDYRYINQNRDLMKFESNGDFTGYQWQRKFKYIKNNRSPQIKVNAVFTNNKGVTSEKLTLSYPCCALNKGWHHFTMTYNVSTSEFKFYVDAKKVDIITIPSSTIYFDYKTPLIIGANVGIYNSIDTEVSNSVYHFKGGIDDVRIYSNELSNSDILQIYMAKRKFNDIIWNIPTGNQNYLEEIERFFKNKIPGMKSNFFNIKIINLKIDNEEIKSTIENIIKNTIDKLIPAQSSLYKITWDE